MLGIRRVWRLLSPLCRGVRGLGRKLAHNEAREKWILSCNDEEFDP